MQIGSMLIWGSTAMKFREFQSFSVMILYIFSGFSGGKRGLLKPTPSCIEKSARNRLVLVCNVSSRWSAVRRSRRLGSSDMEASIFATSGWRRECARSLQSSNLGACGGFDLGFCSRCTQQFLGHRLRSEKLPLSFPSKI